MAKVTIITHPLVRHKLTLMRDSQTSGKEFREAAQELAMLLVYEATRDLPMKEISIETPLAQATCPVISGARIAFVPILRAGLGLLDGGLALIPNAKVAHLGLYRDPATLQPVTYYEKMPKDICERECIIMDPMCATAGSMTAAIDLLKEKGVKKIKVICLMMSQFAVDELSRLYPDIEVYTSGVDAELNDHGYIIPGLGDAGDRLYGTK